MRSLPVFSGVRGRIMSSDLY